MASGAALKQAGAAIAADAKNIAAKVGVIRKFGQWLITPKGVTGYIGKLPFYGPYHAYQKAKAATIFGYNQAKARLAPYWGPTKKTLQVVPDTAVGAGQIVGGPFYEAYKGAFVDFPQRAFINSARIEMAALWNIPAAGATSAVNAGKTILASPWNIPMGFLRGAHDILWKAPQLLMHREVRKAVMTVLGGAGRPFAEIGKVPLSVLNIPYQVGMETALAATQMGLNVASAISTPLEAAIKGYRWMGRGFSGIGHAVVESFRLGHAQSFRERFRGALEFAPMRTAFAAA